MEPDFQWNKNPWSTGSFILKENIYADKLTKDNLYFALISVTYM